MESRLQNGTFIYKTGFLITKCVFHLQNGILALQTGISFCNSSLKLNYIDKLLILKYNNITNKCKTTIQSMVEEESSWQNRY